MYWSVIELFIFVYFSVSVVIKSPRVLSEWKGVFVIVLVFVQSLFRFSLSFSYEFLSVYFRDFRGYYIIRECKGLFSFSYEILFVFVGSLAILRNAFGGRSEILEKNRTKIRSPQEGCRIFAASKTKRDKTPSQPPRGEEIESYKQWDAKLTR